MSSFLLKGAACGGGLKISDDEFSQLRDFIYDLCGIYIASNRKYLLENRLGNRLRKLKLKDFNEYYHFLRYDMGKGMEMKRLFEVITTNETSFYRNPPQLQVFQDHVLPDVLATARKNGKKLRIWSAGCSTGEEPYTLSIIIQEALGPERPLWDVRITANDLSERVLDSAKRAVYGKYSLRSTPDHIVERYFASEGLGFKVQRNVRDLVDFGQMNLKDLGQIRNVERSHVVFCRNVIIYFDDEMKKRVIRAFYDNLLPGGYLIIGHSESLHSISRAFNPIHYPGAIIYKKSE